MRTTPISGSPPKGIAIGCVRPQRAGQFGAKLEALEVARALARSLSVTPNEAARHGIALKLDGQRRTAFELLSYPTLKLADLTRLWPQFLAFDTKIAEQLETDAKYAVYLDRQASDVASYRRDEAIELPDDLDYAALNGLSNEVRQTLQSKRPRTIGHAGQLDGITPVALTLLVAHVRRKDKGRGRPAA